MREGHGGDSIARLDAVTGGRSPYNRIFEFNYSINGHACRMLVTSVTGHLMELEFEDRFLPHLSHRGAVARGPRPRCHGGTFHGAHGRSQEKGAFTSPRYTLRSRLCSYYQLCRPFVVIVAGDAV
jgi:hypothetical protein